MCGASARKEFFLHFSTEEFFCDNFPMRYLPLVVLIVVPAFGQSGPRVQFSHTTENLRGVSAVSRQVAWASGTHGTYLRTTDSGRTWTSAQVPDAVALDFRAVAAFSADEAFLMSAGPGDQSRIYPPAMRDCTGNFSSPIRIPRASLTQWCSGTRGMESFGRSHSG